VSIESPKFVLKELLPDLDPAKKAASLQSYNDAIVAAEQAGKELAKVLAQNGHSTDSTGISHRPVLTIGRHERDHDGRLQLLSGYEVQGTEYKPEEVTFMGTWRYEANKNIPSVGRGIEIVDGRRKEKDLTFVRVGTFVVPGPFARLQTGLLFVIPGVGQIVQVGSHVKPKHIVLPAGTEVRFVHKGSVLGSTILIGSLN
jgi:hypothetical protein